MICADIHQVPSVRVRITSWMAGISPAMTQVIEIYKYRHAGLVPGIHGVPWNDGLY
jgi:hypothetical protein